LLYSAGDNFVMATLGYLPQLAIGNTSTTTNTYQTYRQ
jgi:hypothetical protein